MIPDCQSVSGNYTPLLMIDSEKSLLNNKNGIMLTVHLNSSSVAVVFLIKMHESLSTCIYLLVSRMGFDINQGLIMMFKVKAVFL